MVETDQLKEPKPLRNYFCCSYKSQTVTKCSPYGLQVNSRACYFTTMHTELSGAGKLQQKKLRCTKRAELR